MFDNFYSSGVQYISNDTYEQATVQNAGKALLEKIGKKTIVLGHSQAGIFPPLIADAKPELVQALVMLEPTGPQFREAVFSQKPARAWGLTDVPFTYEPVVTNPTKELKQKIFAARAKDEAECVLQDDEDPTHKPRQLKNLVDIPILVVTAESSYHAVYDYCTVEYLKQGGCSKTEHYELAKMGIRGNGHMLFLEKNSQEIQKKVEHWIRGVC
jgi:pimeloyl-ACP methyl ester carboxylesterase